jgi:hypothetical protein
MVVSGAVVRSGCTFLVVMGGDGRDRSAVSGVVVQLCAVVERLCGCDHRYG